MMHQYIDTQTQNTRYINKYMHICGDALVDVYIYTSVMRRIDTFNYTWLCRQRYMVLGPSIATTCRLAVVHQRIVTVLLDGCSAWTWTQASVTLRTTSKSQSRAVCGTKAAMMFFCWAHPAHSGGPEQLASGHAPVFLSPVLFGVSSIV